MMNGMAHNALLGGGVAGVSILRDNAGVILRDNAAEVLFDNAGGQLLWASSDGHGIALVEIRKAA